jgi:hypothetical protein
MTAISHLDRFAFTGTHSKTLFHPACTGLPPPQPLSTILHCPAFADVSASCHKQESKNGALHQPPASIGPFKLHRRPPPQRLPSSRCI